MVLFNSNLCSTNEDRGFVTLAPLKQSAKSLSNSFTNNAFKCLLKVLFRYYFIIYYPTL